MKHLSRKNMSKRVNNYLITNKSLERVMVAPETAVVVVEEVYSMTLP